MAELTDCMVLCLALSRTPGGKPVLDGKAPIDAVDEYGNKPIHDASATGVDEVQVLLDTNADPNCVNKHGETPLHLAIGKTIAKVLLKALSNPLAADNRGETALHVARGYTILGYVLSVIGKQTDDVCSTHCTFSSKHLLFCLVVSHLWHVGLTMAYT